MPHRRLRSLLPFAALALFVVGCQNLDAKKLEDNIRDALKEKDEPKASDDKRKVDWKLASAKGGDDDDDDKTDGKKKKKKSGDDDDDDDDKGKSKSKKKKSKGDDDDDD